MTQPNPADIEAASIAFDEYVQHRHTMGGEKYGPVRFLEIDSIEMALEELADLANYTRYTFIKLWLLRDQLMPRIPTQLGPDAVKNPHAGR